MTMLVTHDPKRKFGKMRASHPPKMENAAAHFSSLLPPNCRLQSERATFVKLVPGQSFSTAKVRRNHGNYRRDMPTQS